uniref:SAND domain-containing protein n=1 Tax=Astyanax mexicanus TaxID=7994 RepID=A0A3B1IFY3_ASTMX
VPVWTWGIYKTQLPVKCGTKEGTLYREKLATGGECILSQGSWFTPTGFEKFAGKERCKNWKLSIRCQDTPLQKLIEVNVPYLKKRSTLDITSGEEEQEELSGVEELEEREGEEEEENEDDSEDDEDETGIRTEERWFTPEEFVKHGLNLTDGHWKKDIRCHGKTFNYLLKKKILGVHSLLCKCKLCGSKEQDQDNDDVCFICNSVGDLLCCDECPRSFHLHCHLPVITDETLGCWHNGHMTQRELLDSDITQYTVVQSQINTHTYTHTHRHRHTHTNSHISIPDFCVSVISKPMWLNRVKEKLQNKEYRTLIQFTVTPVCVCLQGNEFDKLGSRLSEVFEEAFHTIFNIQ